MSHIKDIKIGAALAQPESEPSDREALIARYTKLHHLRCNADVNELCAWAKDAFDMLEADAQEIARLKDLLGKANALARIRADKLAQQVAVPQDKQVDRSYVNGLKRGYTLGHLGHDDKYRAEVAAYQREIEATPHPAYVPLTDVEIDALWRSVDYIQPYDTFRIAVGRAIEQAVRGKT